MMMLLRCHPIRCIRYGLLIVGAAVTFAGVWRFLSNNDNIVGQHGHSDLANGDDMADDFDQRRFGLQQIGGQLTRAVEFETMKPVVLNEAAQSQLDYIADYLDVRYNVVSNEGGRFHVDLILTNTGSRLIERCCFSIFFSHMKFIDTYAFNAGVSVPLRGENFAAVRAQQPDFAINHVNGYNFELQPTASFTGLESGSSRKLRMIGGGWAVSRGEVLPNWYVVGDSKTTYPRLIKSTAGEEMDFVGAFDSIEKTIRGDEDLYRPFTPEQRYQRNKVMMLAEKSISSVLPTPLIVKYQNRKQSVFISGNSWKIYFGKQLQNEARYLKDALHISSMHHDDEIECERKSIVLRITQDKILLSEDLNRENFIMDEAYSLSVSAERECVVIAGQTPAGVFYGVVSLVSLAHGTAVSSGGYKVECVELIDAPRYEYRGVMIDVARNFHTVEEILKLIDNLALYKLNKLHLHLSDDEGWRLEIPAFPELVEVGSRRGHDLKEREHLMSMLGSGPYINSSGSGYYSVEDYRTILRHAVSRHVEVIPEFDMPSHSHAAIKSMERRYKRLRDKSANAADVDAARSSSMHLLSDLEDESIYMTGQFFRDSAINPCIESSFRFVDAVMSAVVLMHKDIMPLKRWHFGGDEVPQDAYSASPVCYKFMQHHSRLKSTKDLKTYFVRRVVAIAARHGLSIYGWDDAFSSNSGAPIARQELKNDYDVVSQAYYNTWESGAASKAYQFANSGYKVVLSPLTALYFDNPQEPDPEDWGLHWATRYVDTRRAFRFAPESMYDSIDEEFWGQPTSKHKLCDSHRILCLDLKHPENILGMEAVLWTELVRTSSRMDWMLWPRILALAERSWHKAFWEQPSSMETDRRGRTSINETALAEDWARFAFTVGRKELRRLEAQGVEYYLPRPGARIHGGKLYVNTAFPGLIVQVSSDEGKTWSDFTKGVPYTGELLLATRSYDRRRRSVPVKITLSSS